MALNTAALLTGHVAHARLSPKRNAFRYGIYYLALPLEDLENFDGVKKSPLAEILPINRAGHRGGVHSFHTADHGARQPGASLTDWAHAALIAHHRPTPSRITLICMPRVLGYVFNPVSFWLCWDAADNLQTVIAEVSNTFGETHSYICAHKKDAKNGNRAIRPNDWLCAEKCFHVSPFLVREGYYQFRFDMTNTHCHIDINYHGADGALMLTTSLVGTFAPLTKRALKRAFWRTPWMTAKAIILIHWQAVRLVVRGIKYCKKPAQHKARITQ